MPKIIPQKRPAVLAAALKLHGRGLWVVPCNGKVATKKDWPNERVERAELEKALRANPALSIGIVISQSDLLDIDCDTPEAEAALLELFGGAIPLTPAWQSKRGKHYLFRRPADLPNKAKLELDGIEFRIGNKGALSIVPPSDGRRWLPGQSLDEVEPAELPEHIAERLRATEPKPAAPSTGSDEIPEGKRNDSLFQKACALGQLKLPEETIAATLLDLNQRLCKPPLPDSEVRAIAHSAATGEKPKIGFLARLLGNIELWHDENADPFATLPQGDHRENWKIGKRCRAFRRWLSKLYYDATGSVISASELADLAAMLEGKAVFDGPQFQLWRRVAEHNGKLYLDLCDEEWRAVEIDANGWCVVSDPPVKFFRARAMHPLPVPARLKKGESLRSLLEPFLNLGPISWPLVAAWLAAALRAIGPYPVLKLLGEQGSAKTTTARVLRSVIDPNAAPVRAEPRDTRDIMIAANNGWVLCLDNLSTVKPDLSDALCRLSTGGGFATRTLYTDEDETIFDATRPVILTSIEEIGTRSDLLERSLIIELPTISEAARRAEKSFWAEFEKVRPRILGALLDVVSGAIRRLPEIERRPNAGLSRMADFEQWGEAAELALGLEPGEFAEAYRANRDAATQVALESCPIVSALLKLLKTYPQIEDTASTLLERLEVGNYDLTRAPGWPKTPRVLSQILGRVAPNLRQVGIKVERYVEDNEKLWRISGPPAVPQNTQNTHHSHHSHARSPARTKAGGLAKYLHDKGVTLPL